MNFAGATKSLEIPSINMLDDAIKFIGGTFVVSAILAWLIRSLVTHFLSKDVESYKLQLQSEAATELEKLKHQLRLVAAEHGGEHHFFRRPAAE